MGLEGIQVDVRALAPESRGAALLYFTGSKSHNVALRQRALKMGYTLNEYALSRLEGGEVAAASAAILRDANGLPGDPRNRLVLRDGPRESSDAKVSLYVLSRPAGGTRDLVGLDARLWPLLEGLELWGDGPREPVAGFKDGQITALAMPRILSEADKDPAPPNTRKPPRAKR